MSFMKLLLRKDTHWIAQFNRLKDWKQTPFFCITAPNKTQSFQVCLDEELTETNIEHLDLSKDSVFICRDVALNDTLAANLALQCRLKTI